MKCGQFCANFQISYRVLIDSSQPSLLSDFLYFYFSIYFLVVKERNRNKRAPKKIKNNMPIFVVILNDVSPVLFKLLLILLVSRVEKMLQPF